MITIKEIAEQAGLSIGTVDRVLHGRGRVSKETEQKIKSIIKKTGYRTNIHARNLSMQTTHNFGVIMPFPRQDGGYWEILRKGIDQAEGELTSFNVHNSYFFFDKYSESSFLKAGREAIEKRMAGLLIAPVLLDACPSFVKSIPPDVPYVYVDSTIPGTNPLAAIGQDSFQSGVCGAKLMRMLVGERGGTVAVLRMLPNDFHINERVWGFSSFFSDDPSFTVHVFDVDGGADDREFAEGVKTIDSSIERCGGYFVTNAETHRVAKALNGTRNDVKRVIGYDCIEENLRLLREGSIDFIISQNTREQGYAGINTLFRHVVLKESYAAEMRMPIGIVMAENCSYYQ
ncbi:MAG: LacI family DNA-binding transcriptional regulator [Chitinispirillaceae bacterium]|nr:LacI family DNA-binding transcriptional regulator [Chitinispirillaceae bacterium]